MLQASKHKQTGCVWPHVATAFSLCHMPEDQFIYQFSTCHSIFYCIYMYSTCILHVYIVSTAWPRRPSIHVPSCTGTRSQVVSHAWHCHRTWPNDLQTAPGLNNLNMLWTVLPMTYFKHLYSIFKHPQLAAACAANRILKICLWSYRELALPSVLQENQQAIWTLASDESSIT